MSGKSGTNDPEDGQDEVRSAVPEPEATPQDAAADRTEAVPVASAEPTPPPQAVAGDAAGDGLR
ncbi:hypothetical protein G6038_26375, partial [Rhodococcus sp. 14C212]|nr:hypothetical protein [Rhodococcus sp. 14C212]